MDLVIKNEQKQSIILPMDFPDLLHVVSSKVLHFMSTNIFAKDIIYITYNIPYLYEKQYRYVVITYPVY